MDEKTDSAGNRSVAVVRGTTSCRWLFWDNANFEQWINNK